MERQEE